MKEISKEELLKLPNGTIYYTYNPLTNTYHEETLGKNDIAHSKYAYDKLKYYLKKEVSND